MTDVLTRREDETQTEENDTGRGGRGWWDVATSQGLLVPPEAGRGSKDSPLQVPEDSQPCRHLSFGLLASRTVRE